MTTKPIVDTRSEKGMALVVVLLLMAVLSGLATGFAMNGQTESAMAVNEVYYAGARAAAEAGISTWQAEVAPAAKAERLAALAARGRRVLMVGDGLNDAPALAAAHASISPATAAEATQNAADAVFQGDALQPVVEALDVARRADRLVRQNLAIALLYNLSAVPLAILGEVTPLVAAVAMSSSSLLVIGNALRLGAGQSREAR
jgi:Cu2+-exporting ATPase